MKRKRTKQIRTHFNKRVGERLGFAMPNGSQADIVAMIQQGKANFLRRSSNSRTVWSVNIEGEPYTVIYDSRRKVLVTIWKEQEG